MSATACRCGQPATRVWEKQPVCVACHKTFLRSALKTAAARLQRELDTPEFRSAVAKILAEGGAR